MKTLFIIFICLISSSSIAQPVDPLDNRAIYVKAFVESVQLHQNNKTLKLMQRTYRKDQIRFLDGNKEQFLDELFAGEDMLGAGFVSFNYDEITSFEVAEVIPLDNGDFNYIFRVKDGKHDALCNLVLEFDGKNYRFVGASG